MAMFVAKTCGPLYEVEEFTRMLAGAEVNVAIGLKTPGTFCCICNQAWNRSVWNLY